MVFLPTGTQVHKRMNDSGEFALGRHRRSNATLSQVKGLGRDADLKSIMVKHLSGDYNENLCYAVIFAISSLEKDIKQHNRIRYRILTPMVSAMEKLCI